MRYWYFIVSAKFLDQLDYADKGLFSSFNFVNWLSFRDLDFFFFTFKSLLRDNNLLVTFVTTVSMTS